MRKSCSSRNSESNSLRSALGWSRNQLAHVMNASDRAIVNWEAGDPISPVYAAKLREIQSVYNDQSLSRNTVVVRSEDF